MTFASGPKHKDMRASVRHKGTRWEKKIPAHRTISWTDKSNGTTLLVKVFDRNHIEMSMNGTLELSLDDLAAVRDECVRYLGGGIDG